MAIEQQARPLRTGAPSPHGPAVTITRRAADNLRAGSVWVYRSEVENVTPALTPGALVTVLDGRGLPLGSALFSSASQITLRLVSTEPALSREAYLAQLAERVEAALDLREKLSPGTARRLIFSEADQLPGIIADQYHDLVILQLLTQGTGPGGRPRHAHPGPARTPRPGHDPRAARPAHPRRRRPAPHLRRAAVRRSRRPAARHHLQPERDPLRVRQHVRPEDRSVPRPASELRRRSRLCAWKGARRLHLPGRVRAAPGADLRARHRRRRQHVRA